MIGIHGRYPYFVLHGDERSNLDRKDFILSQSLPQISDTGTYICFAPDHPPSPGSQVSMYLAVTKSG